ncbi:MAG: amidohydrolase family protein, partial [Gemmatimonadota bacterium]
MAHHADAHIHLFEHNLQGTFADRPGVHMDEAACYDSLAADHDVAAALVVCYAAGERYAGNNEYVAGLIPRYGWIRPAAYVDVTAPPGPEALARWRDQGFVGLTMYPGAAAARLHEFPDEVWEWLTAHQWLLSVNSNGAGWPAWVGVLERHPELRLVLSHLGLPAKVTAPIDGAAARAALAPQIRLAQFPQVRVKLSGFYALTEPSHDYPHALAWPYVEALAGAFGTGRLLWGSDYTPCLNHHTFVQTLGIFAKMPFLSGAEREAIGGGNLL